MYLGGADGPAWFEFTPTGWDDHRCNVDASWLTHGNARSVNIYRCVHVWGVRGRIDTSQFGAWSSEPDQIVDVGIQPRTEYRGVERPMGFGSWHTGVCNFAVGDGSVASVGDSVNSRILSKLGIANDGLSVAIP